MKYQFNEHAIDGEILTRTAIPLSLAAKLYDRADAFTDPAECTVRVRLDMNTSLDFIPEATGEQA